MQTSRRVDENTVSAFHLFTALCVCVCIPRSVTCHSTHHSHSVSHTAKLVLSISEFPISISHSQ